MMFLQLRMGFLLAALFAIMYMVVVMIGTYMGIGDFYLYLGLSFALIFVQYLIGPAIVQWTMRVRYVKREEYPKLYEMVQEMAAKAHIPVPRIGISAYQIPNAFAFGRSIRDGRVCVTDGILRLLNDEELKAVLGHELTHLKNRDMLTITILSVIPMIMYRIAWHFLFYGRRRDERGGNVVLVGMAAFFFYFITNLLVLYASRIREYFADRGSVLLGNKPAALASSLYKLAYGCARADKEAVREAEGLKAFFVNDPSRALNEVREVSQLDLDKSGAIDSFELARLKNSNLRLSFADKAMEILSTHPSMLKRIKQLSEF